MRSVVVVIGSVVVVEVRVVDVLVVEVVVVGACVVVVDVLSATDAVMGSVSAVIRTVVVVTASVVVVIGSVVLVVVVGQIAVTWPVPSTVTSSSTHSLSISHSTLISWPSPAQPVSLLKAAWNLPSAFTRHAEAT